MAFPIYIAVIFSYQKMKRLSILTRLGIGLFLFLAGVLSVVITDIVGHAKFEVKPNSSSLCMFAMHFEYFGPHLPSLDFTHPDKSIIRNWPFTCVDHCI